MIIQTILLDPSGADWTDGPSNVSRLDPSAADQIDAKHQATDLAVVFVGRQLAARGSGHDIAAGDVEGDAGDPGGAFRGQEHGREGDVFGGS